MNNDCLERQLGHSQQLSDLNWFIMQNCLYSKQKKENPVCKQRCTCQSEVLNLQKQLAGSHRINKQLQDQIDNLQRTLQTVLSQLADQKLPSQTVQNTYYCGKESVPQKDKLQHHLGNLEEEIRILYQVKNAYKAEMNRIAEENFNLRNSNEELRTVLDHKFEEIQSLLEENMQLEQELKLRMRFIKRTQKQVKEYGKELKKNCSVMEAYEGEILQTKVRLANNF